MDLKMDLINQKCIPCEGGMDPLKREEFTPYLTQVSSWLVVDDKKLTREFIMKNFKEVIDLVNRIAAIAESEGHHPDLFIHDWKYLTVTLTTHAIGGLSINDFVMAVKIDNSF